MANTLLTFNAKSVEPSLLEQTLIGRKSIVDEIEKELASKAKEKHTYQSLIIAPRGSGKTHMITVLYNRLNKNKVLATKIRIAYMIEDEVGIANFLDFMVRVLEAIVRYNEPNSEAITASISEIADMNGQYQEATMKNLLLNYLGDRTLVILIENLNVVFEGMGKEGQAKLRDFMHEHNKISLIATTQNLFAQVQQSSYPFYNFFKTFHLNKLDYLGSLAFIKAIANAEKKDSLDVDLDTPENIGKIRAIYELTGGNHRLLVIFYSFLKADIKHDLSVIFVKTMNDLKPYYEQFIKELSIQQQKIVKHLSLKHTPQKGKDIARACFMTQNIISKQLSELYNKGHIDKHKEGKEVYYELKEPLMRICFEINESPDGIAKLFVDFLSVVYSSDELKRKYLKFKYGAKFQPIKIREKFHHESMLIGKALNPKDLELLSDLPNVEKFRTENDLEAFIEEFDKIDVDSIFLDQGFGYFKDGKVEEALASYQKAIEANPNNYLIYFAKGIIYAKIGRYEDAKLKLSKALEINPKDDVLYNVLGIVYENLYDYKEAISSYQKAVQINPENDQAYHNIGSVFSKLGKYEDAIPALQKAQKINQKNDLAWTELGNVYGRLERYQEATTSFLKATQINPSNEIAYNNLGLAYIFLGKNKEAIKALQKSITINSSNFNAYSHLGLAYFMSGKYNKATEVYQKATVTFDEANDNKADGIIAYLFMGFTYLKQKNFGEALSAFKAGLNISKIDINLNFKVLHTCISMNNSNASKAQLNTSLKLVNEKELLQNHVNQDILYPLFRYGSISYINSFFPYLIAVFKKKKIESVLWKAFPQAIFELLIKIENYDQERLAGIEELLAKNLSKIPEAKISLLMLNVGIRYLKHQEKRAIYDLSKEERKVFKEFVLDPRAQKQSK